MDSLSSPHFSLPQGIWIAEPKVTVESLKTAFEQSVAAEKARSTYASLHCQWTCTVLGFTTHHYKQEFLNFAYYLLH